MNKVYLIGFMLLLIICGINSSCQKQVDNSAASIDSLKTAVSILQKRTDSLTSAFAITNNNISTLSKSLDSIKTQLSVIMGQINTLNTQLTSVNANITQINAQISVLNQQYSDLLKILNDILARLSITPTTLNNGLVGYFSFTGNANDSSGYSNNGLVNGATLTSDRFGNPNSAYNFNNNYILIPNSSNYAFNNFSISLWISSTSTLIQTAIKKNFYQNAGSEQFAIAFNDLNQYGVEFACKYNNPNCTSGVGWLKNEKIQNILDGKFHNIVGTANGGITNLWIDGKLVNTSTSTSSSVSSCFNGDIQIGRDWSQFANYFIGKIDDVRIYNRVLTDTEISYLSTH